MTIQHDKHKNDELPLAKRCKIDNCNSKTHTTEDNKCTDCVKLGHDKNLCTLPMKPIGFEYDNNFIPFDSALLNNKCDNCSRFDKVYILKEEQYLCYNCLSKKSKKKISLWRDRDVNNAAPVDIDLYTIVKNKMGDKDGSIWLEEYGGMGCVWYFKRNSINDHIWALFMHSDCWGQYGSETSDVPYLNYFLRDCNKIK